MQLISLVAHGTGHVLAQTRVGLKQHERRAVPALLANHDLSHAVITLDAGFTVPRVAQQILKQGGHYLMVVKRNQHDVHEALTWYFDM